MSNSNNLDPNQLAKSLRQGQLPPDGSPNSPSTSWEYTLMRHHSIRWPDKWVAVEGTEDDAYAEGLADALQYCDINTSAAAVHSAYELAKGAGEAPLTNDKGTPVGVVFKGGDGGYGIGPSSDGTLEAADKYSNFWVEVKQSEKKTAQYEGFKPEMESSQAQPPATTPTPVAAPSEKKNRWNPKKWAINVCGRLNLKTGMNEIIEDVVAWGTDSSLVLVQTEIESAEGIGTGWRAIAGSGSGYSEKGNYVVLTHSQTRGVVARGIVYGEFPCTLDGMAQIQKIIGRSSIAFATFD